MMKMDIGLVEFENSTDNNMVLGVNHTSKFTRNLPLHQFGSIIDRLCVVTAGTSVILDTRNTTTGRGKWKSFGCQKGEQEHHLWLGTSDDGTAFDVEKRHSAGGVPFGGASLDGHMNAIFDERTQRWIGFLRCATLNSVTPTNWELP